MSEGNEITAKVTLTITGRIAYKRLDHAPNRQHLDRQLCLGVAFRATGGGRVFHEALFYRGTATQIDDHFAEGDLVMITGCPEYRLRADAQGNPELFVLLAMPIVQQLSAPEA